MPAITAKKIKKRPALIVTRLLYWPIDVAVKRLVDLDLRSRDQSAEFYTEFDTLNPTAAKAIYAKARDGYLSDLIASPEGSRLVKATAVLHMAALRQTLQGLDGIFLTSLGLTRFDGDKTSFDAGLKALQQARPLTALGGDGAFTFVYDFHERLLKPMSLHGINAVISGDPSGQGDLATTLRPGRDFGNVIDSAVDRFGVDRADAADCEGTAKTIGHWVGAAVGGYCGGVGGAAAGTTIGGTLGWIAGGPFGAAPGAAGGAVAGTIIGGTIGGEIGSGVGEAVGSWAGGVVCGGGETPSPGGGGDGGGEGDGGTGNGSAGAGTNGGSNGGSDGGGSSGGDSSGGNSGGGGDSSGKSGGGGGSGDDGGGDEDPDTDAAMANPEWDDGSGGGPRDPGERDPSLGPKFGTRAVVARWFNPAVMDPVDAVSRLGSGIPNFDMSRLPQAFRLDRGYGTRLNGFADAYRSLAKSQLRAGDFQNELRDRLGRDLGRDARASGMPMTSALSSVKIDGLLSQTPAEGEALRLIGEGVARFLTWKA